MKLEEREREGGEGGEGRGQCLTFFQHCHKEKKAKKT